MEKPGTAVGCLTALALHCEWPQTEKVRCFESLKLAADALLMKPGD